MAADVEESMRYFRNLQGKVGWIVFLCKALTQCL